MNFGHGITIALALFMSFIGYLAYMSFQQKVDLVAENYYEREVKFQQQIDKTQNVKDLGQNPVIIKVAGGQKITFPNTQTANNIKGKIEFFRASDDQLDFELPIVLNTNGEQIIESDKFKTGKYQLKVEWTYEDKSFYYEQNIVI